MKYIYPICLTVVAILALLLGSTSYGRMLESVEQEAYCYEANAKLHIDLSHAMDVAMALNPNKQEDDFTLMFMPIK